MLGASAGAGFYQSWLRHDDAGKQLVEPRGGGKLVPGLQWRNDDSSHEDALKNGFAYLC